jgi:hypothetical protein
MNLSAECNTIDKFTTYISLRLEYRKRKVALCLVNQAPRGEEVWGVVNVEFQRSS